VNAGQLWEEACNQRTSERKGIDIKMKEIRYVHLIFLTCICLRIMGIRSGMMVKSRNL
jgi:hypothetical protein